MKEKLILREEFESVDGFMDGIIEAIEKTIFEIGLPPTGWRYEVVVTPVEGGAKVWATDYMSSGTYIRYRENEVVFPVNLQTQNIPYYPEHYGYYPLLLKGAGLSKEAEMVSSWEKAERILAERLGPYWAEKINESVWDEFYATAEEALLEEFLQEEIRPQAWEKLPKIFAPQKQK